MTDPRNTFESKLFCLIACGVLTSFGCDDDSITFTRPTICVRPETSIDFGTQLIRSAGTRAVAITNCGSALIERVSARIVDVETGAPIDDPFSILATEVPSPLQPAEFFRLSLRFRPEEAGSYSATLELSLDDFEVADRIVRVPMTGQGVLPESCVPVLDPSLVFDTTEVGASREGTLALRNDGSGVCMISGARILDDDDANFAVIDPPSGELTSGSSIDVTVRYAPRVPGAHSANLAVVVDGDTQLTADLTGNAVRNERCAWLATPSTVVFPRAILGTLSTSQSFEIESVGEQDCTVATIEISDAPGEFAIVRGPSPNDLLAAGTSTTIEVEFTPAAAGPRNGNLRVTSTDGYRLDVALSAFADPRPSCALRFDPSPLTFQPIAVGLSAEADVTLTNLSQLDCTITDVNIVGGGLSLIGDGTGPLTPGATRTVRVRYAPVVAAPTIGELQIELDGTSMQTDSVVAFGDYAELRLTPSLQHVGIVTEGCASREHTISLTNVGPVAARIDQIAFAPTTDPNFQLLTPITTPRMIDPAQNIPLRVRMLGAPAYGGQTAKLEVRSTGTIEPIVSAELRGTSESTTSASRRDVFIQTEESAVDILFVVDDSCSMADEQASLASNFQSFIDFFVSEVTVDYHIGITTTDTTVRNGALVGPYIRNMGPNPTPNPTAVFTSQVNVGTSGSGTERGLLASVMAVSSPNTDPGGANDGFLRDDALLSIIYVTDEEDQSPGTVSSYLDQLLAAKGYRSELLLTSAIAGNVPGGCPGATAAFRYYDMVQNTQFGIFESICTPDWALTMQQLGFTTFAALTRFKLNRTPGPSTIVVMVDGMIVPNDPQNGWTYDPVTNSIVFNGTSVPDPGSEIEVQYMAECLPI